MGQTAQGLSRQNGPHPLRTARRQLTREHVPLDWARIKTKLAIVLEKLGEIHLASNDRSGARERYQQALAARQELADSDIVDVDQRLDLVRAHYKLAQAGFEKSENVEKAWVILLDLEAAGRLAPEQAEWMWRLLGLEGRHEASKRMEAVLVATEAGEVKAKGGAGEATADRLGQVARYALFASQYGRANTAADRAIGLAPKFNLFFSIYKAHAQFFLARTDRERLLAREFYKQRVGQKVWPSSELWERVIADDFAEFRAAGIDHPMMKEIEADLGIAARPDQPPR